MSIHKHAFVISSILLGSTFVQATHGNEIIDTCQTTAETLAVVDSIPNRSAAVSEPLIGTFSNSAFDALNIEEFLSTCPQNDTALATISRDFKIRKNGQLTPLPECSEPVSGLPIGNYTDELIVLQGLRVMFYMDRSQTGHLPWTELALYKWLASKISGIDIRDNSGAYCCRIYDGETYFVVPSGDETSREWDRSWTGIAGNIGLYAHEARHVDGFPHVSCCGISGGCDQQFNSQNLAPYGIQWWLNSLWAEGTINVGFGCLDNATSTASYHVGSCNGAFRGRFCENLPEELAEPLIPGGECELNAFYRLLFFDGFEQ